MPTESPALEIGQYWRLNATPKAYGLTEIVRFDDKLVHVRDHGAVLRSAFASMYTFVPRWTPAMAPKGRQPRFR